LWRPAISSFKCPKKSGQQGSTRHLKVRTLKVKYCSRGLPTAFFPDIAPSRMFTTTQELRVIQQWKEWLATIPDGKLPTNQKI